jgi:hypothetical protein
MMKSKFKLHIVKDKNTIKQFLSLPSYLNREDSNYIRPLDNDIKKIFDPKQNKKLRNGNAIRWILVDEYEKTIGRIAAFFESAASKKETLAVGGCGFFECICNQEAANILFDAAREWLKENKMNAMDGPINFGSRETFWGCLSEGYYEPNYNMPYNKPYYNDLFEGYGFRNYFNQYTYHMPLDPGIMDPSIPDNAERIKDDPGYLIRNLDKGQLDKFADDFTSIFNQAWAKFPGVKPMNKKQTLAMFKSMKQIVDVRALIFAYYEDKPIGFFMMIPDLFQSYKKFNGKFGPVQKLQLLYDLKVSKPYTKLIGLIFGVIPEFQKKGVSGGMIMHFANLIRSARFKYTDLEMNWIGDFNPGMIKLVLQLGAKVRKTHITYRYLFDRNEKFERAKRLS